MAETFTVSVGKKYIGYWQSWSEKHPNISAGLMELVKHDVATHPELYPKKL